MEVRVSFRRIPSRPEVVARLEKRARGLAHRFDHDARIGATFDKDGAGVRVDLELEAAGEHVRASARGSTLDVVIDEVFERAIRRIGRRLAHPALVETQHDPRSEVQP
jgi:ribosome-associated translation inhibitor RaiA